MSIQYKPTVNKVLEKNEIKVDDLVFGREYLLEFNMYNENKTIKTRGIFIEKQIFLSPYIMTFFKTSTTTSTIIYTMFNEVSTRYYLPITNKIKQKSLERQAFAQTINKLIMDKSWRSKCNKNSIGNELVKIYY
jgi:hypothetical protein